MINNESFNIDVGIQNRTYLQGTTLSSTLEMENTYNPNLVFGSLKFNSKTLVKIRSLFS